MIVFSVLKIRLSDGKAYADQIKKNFRVEQQRGVRGNLLAVNGDILVAPTVTYDASLDPMVIQSKDLPDLPAACSCIADVIGRTGDYWEGKILQKRAQKSKFLRIHSELSIQQYKQLKKCPILQRNKNLGGLIARPREDRLYLHDSMAKVALGIVDSGRGKRGLEIAFESQLSGDSLDVLYKRDSHGTFLPEDGPRRIPEPGKDLVLSLDIPAQEIVETVLRNCVKRSAADHGSAILMEVATGKVRALANMKRGTDGRVRNSSQNFAVVEQLELGSVMKPPAILSLLDQGKVHPNTELNIGNGIRVYHKKAFKDPVRFHGDSVVTVARALQLSSNVAMVDLMSRHYQEPEDYVDVYLRGYGFKQASGLEFQGEIAPIYAPYSKLSLPSLGIGYEIRVNPMQVLNFYNTVANDGTFMKPSIVEAVIKEGELLEEFNPDVISSSIVKHPSAISELQRMLKDVVAKGTAKGAHSPMIPIAGKTGTARIYDSTGSGWEVEDYVCSFVGYFPADRPKYSCIVVVNYPTIPSEPTGGKVAAPAVKEIAEKMLVLHPELLPRLEENGRLVAEESMPEIKSAMQQDIVQILQASNIPVELNESTEWVRPKIRGSVIAMDDGGPIYHGENRVPDVVGMGIRDALYILENKGMQVAAKGKGKVIEQFPAPGASYQENMIVNLALQ